MERGAAAGSDGNNGNLGAATGSDDNHPAGGVGDKHPGATTGSDDNHSAGGVGDKHPGAATGSDDNHTAGSVGDKHPGAATGSDDNYGAGDVATSTANQLQSAPAGAEQKKAQGPAAEAGKEEGGNSADNEDSSSDKEDDDEGDVSQERPARVALALVGGVGAAFLLAAAATAASTYLLPRPRLDAAAPVVDQEDLLPRPLPRPRGDTDHHGAADGLLGSLFWEVHGRRGTSLEPPRDATPLVAHALPPVEDHHPAAELLEANNPLLREVQGRRGTSSVRPIGTAAPLSQEFAPTWFVLCPVALLLGVAAVLYLFLN